MWTKELKNDWIIERLEYSSDPDLFREEIQKHWHERFSTVSNIDIKYFAQGYAVLIYTHREDGSEAMWGILFDTQDLNKKEAQDIILNFLPGAEVICRESETEIYFSYYADPPKEITAISIYEWEDGN